MAQRNVQTTLVSTLPSHEVTDELFSQIIERLKTQKAIAQDSFPKDMPFFNFSTSSKETQIKELFQDASDPNFYKYILKNMLTQQEDSSELFTKRISAMQVMTFAQVMLYKILPCHEENCPNRPREIATHNQYKDYEYECPFYHHEKDKRRLVITPVIDEEFIYKANYFEEGKQLASEKEKFSQNYFESMFHPLYYKMFRCKRDHCNLSSCCPFYHCEEEKKTWDRVFSNFIRKDRINYVKDKQKYYEQASQSSNSTPSNKGNNDFKITRANAGQFSQRQNPENNSSPNSPPHDQEQCRPYYNRQRNGPNEQINGWRSDKSYRLNSGKKYDKKKRYNNNSRKCSDDFPENRSNNFESYSNQKEELVNRTC